MLEDKLKIEIKKAMLSKDSVKKDILRLVLGEIQTKSSASDLSEEDKLNIIRKIIKSNIFTLAKSKEVEGFHDCMGVTHLEEENKILSEYLPKALDRDQIKEFITVSELKMSKGDNPGKCMGMVMKALKQQEIVVDSKIVKEVIDELVSN